MTTVRVIAFDMGTANMGVAIIDYFYSKTGKLLRLKLIHCFMVPIKELINDLVGEKAVIQHKAFYRFIFKLVKYNNPGHIVAERFLARGGGIRGALGEKIGYMLGIIYAICHRFGISLDLVTAASWKNQLRRSKIVLEKLYLKSKKHSHLIDSVFINLYNNKALDLIKLQRRQLLNQLMKQILDQPIISSYQQKKRRRKPKQRRKTTHAQ